MRTSNFLLIATIVWSCLSHGRPLDAADIARQIPDGLVNLLGDITKSSNNQSSTATTLKDKPIARKALVAATLALAADQNDASSQWSQNLCAAAALKNRVVGSLGLTFSVYTQDKIGFIVFRGTPSTQVFAEINAVFAPVNCQITTQGCGMVHQGFQDGYLRLRDSVSKWTSQLDSIVLVGHSLGAAFATMTALDILASKKSLKVLGLYTFGAPKIGDAQFTATLEKLAGQIDVQRLVTVGAKGEMDYVSLLPPFFPFQHWKNPTLVSCSGACSLIDIHTVPAYINGLKAINSELRSSPQDTCVSWN